MGTRADFYVGRGESAEWLGSIAYDGHYENFEHMAKIVNETRFRRAADKRFRSCDHATLPSHGWPWPWPDSHITDCTYAFDQGAVYIIKRRWYSKKRPGATPLGQDCIVCGAGGPTGIWIKLKDYLSLKTDDFGDLMAISAGPAILPDMTACQNVALGPRGGVLILGKSRPS